jgi:hypothetical protein
MIQINANLFARVAMAQSSDPGRFYIGGVHVSAHPSGTGVILAATDGHMMLVAYDAAGTPPTQEGGHIINLGKDGLKAAAKGETVTLDPVTGDASVDNAWRSASSTLINGTFPDWRRILPRPATEGEALTHTAASFDPNLLQTLGKALSETPKSPGALRLRAADASNAHLATIANGLPIFGVVMPMRAPDGGDTLPGWMI